MLPKRARACALHHRPKGPAMTSTRLLARGLALPLALSVAACKPTTQPQSSNAKSVLAVSADGQTSYLLYATTIASNDPLIAQANAAGFHPTYIVIKACTPDDRAKVQAAMDERAKRTSGAQQTFSRQAVAFDNSDLAPLCNGRAPIVVPSLAQVSGRFVLLSGVPFAEKRAEYAKMNLDQRLAATQKILDDHFNTIEYYTTGPGGAGATAEQKKQVADSGEAAKKTATALNELDALIKKRDLLEKDGTNWAATISRVIRDFDQASFAASRDVASMLDRRIIDPGKLFVVDAAANDDAGNALLYEWIERMAKGLPTVADLDKDINLPELAPSPDVIPEFLRRSYSVNPDDNIPGKSVDLVDVSIRVHEHGEPWDLKVKGTGAVRYFDPPNGVGQDLEIIDGSLPVYVQTTKEIEDALVALKAAGIGIRIYKRSRVDLQATARLIEAVGDLRETWQLLDPKTTKAFIFRSGLDGIAVQIAAAGGRPAETRFMREDPSEGVEFKNELIRKLGTANVTVTNLSREQWIAAQQATGAGG
jgi:hypothetical protein